MPVSAQWRSNYGGSLVTSKYSPLEDIRHDTESAQYWAAVLNLRMNTLRNLNLLQGLRLTTQDWAGVRTREAAKGRKPPLVVVSSGRAEWIKAGVEAAKRHLDMYSDELGGSYQGVGDMRALGGRGTGPQAGPQAGPPNVMPPIYAPSRVGTERSVYVVVHFAEYDHYVEQLKEEEPEGATEEEPEGATGGATGGATERENLTVIGWQFPGAPTPKRCQMAGFGASRFAALEFCKQLMPQQDGAWRSAWIFDDNVVALSNFPVYDPENKTSGELEHDGLSLVEAALGKNICAGFQAGTSAGDRSTIQGIVTRAVRSPGNLPPLEQKPGLVQQAVLWNISRLKELNINISPAFIASAEDVSFINYLKRRELPYQQYTQISVRKHLAGEDAPTQKTAFLQAFRRNLAKTCADVESAGAQQALPPPVTVHDLAPQEGAAAQTVREFVAAKAPLLSAQDMDKAACQAVEQLIATAVGSPQVPLEDAVLNSVFGVTPTFPVNVQNSSATGGQS
ncbi:hypothetical protein ACIQNG_18710 [Streptomyces sp. NPDC091377]|uniref:hypothetical protein n=1 Tax=Streptomyces sp. NPDC091377 TaxID=3365995 RepID=UPI003821DCF7